MKSILLVDDETIICAELQQTLRQFGFDVERAHTSDAARRLARERRFDAILLEFNVKSERSIDARAGNGLQLLRQLRASRVTIPVIMFTAMEGEPYRAMSLNAGADDFIPRTAGVLLLVSRLRAQLRRRESGFRNGTARLGGGKISRSRKAEL